MSRTCIIWAFETEDPALPAWGDSVEQSNDGGMPSVSRLARRPATLVRNRLMEGLRAAGISDVQPAHLAVFQHPGPDGQRPSVLALRAGTSKQAMNHLLGQLERDGYLSRDTDPRDRRTRVVHLTERGQAVLALIVRITTEVDAQWVEAIGLPTYAGIAHGLARLDEHLDAVVLASRARHP
jgi:DNA-binding MarR family transcriptional regulator